MIPSQATGVTTHSISAAAQTAPIRSTSQPTQLPAAARDYLSPRQRIVYFFEPVMADAADAQEALAA